MVAAAAQVPAPVPVSGEVSAAAAAAPSNPVDTSEFDALRTENEKLLKRMKKHKKEYEALELQRDDLLK